MKNLKRILSLALAGTMLVGMMVVGASAADFADAKDIKHAEAVEFLYTLNVISGNPQPDGSVEFNPTGNLNRAQMAKMLAVVHRGKDDISEFIDINTKSSFTDVPSGQWYVPYIEYCYNLGIVSGYPQPDGTVQYAPTADVTGQEAARMILNLMGYKSYTGRWDIATDLDAQEKGLYDKLADLATTKPISRDDVAQIIFNSLTKDLDSSLGTYNKETTEEQPTGKYLIAAVAGSELDDNLADLAASQKFDSWFEAYTVAGTIDITIEVPVENDDDDEEAEPEEEDEDEEEEDAEDDGEEIPTVTRTQKAVYGTDFTIVAETDTVTKKTATAETLLHKYMKKDSYTGMLLHVDLDEDDDTYNIKVGTLPFTGVENDMSAYLGEKVTVIYAIGNQDNVQGVFVNGSKVLYTGAVSDIQTASNGAQSVGGYSIKSATVYECNVATPSTLAAQKGYYSLKAVSSKGNSTVDTLIVTPFDLDKVENVGKTTLRLASGNRPDLEDVSVYEGIAKGDYVKITPAAQTVDSIPVYEKVTPAPLGKITAMKDGEFRIDGVWYAMADDDDSNLLSDDFTPALNKDIVSAIVINGVVFLAEEEATVAGSNKEYALLIRAQAKQEGTGVNEDTPAMARLLFADGTVEVVEVNDAAENGSFEGFATATYKLVTYTVKSGVYTLTEAANTAAGSGFDKVLDGSKDYTYADGGKSNIDGDYIDPNAVIFVKTATGYTVISGADLALVATAGVTTVHNAYSTNDGTGFSTVALAYIEGDLTPAKGGLKGTQQYGIIMSDLLEVLNDDEDEVYALTVWNGEKEIEVLTTEQNDELKALTGDDVVVLLYTIEGNTIAVEDVIVINNENTDVGAITAWSSARGELKFIAIESGSDTAAKSGTEKTIAVTDDTVILGYDAKGGVEDPEIDRSELTEDEGDEYYTNALIILVNDEADDLEAKLIVLCDNMLGYEAD